MYPQDLKPGNLAVNEDCELKDLKPGNLAVNEDCELKAKSYIRSLPHFPRKDFSLLFPRASPSGLCFHEVTSFIQFPRRESKRRNTLVLK
ncbi:UNVERIFIED_CONTAM: hypothetical protein FKN15_028650 [Acipenser sinensis]